MEERPFAAYVLSFERAMPWTLRRVMSRKYVEGTESWFVVLTTRGKHFYHDKETRESQWSMPPAVAKALGRQVLPPPGQQERRPRTGNGDSEEMEEMVEDAKDVEDEDAYEFGEDDVAFQLLSKDDEEEEEQEEETAVIDKEKMFTEMLRDHAISTFGLWEDVVPRLRQDPRFLLAETVRQAREWFTHYCQQQTTPQPAPTSSRAEPFLALLRSEVKSVHVRWDGFSRKFKRDSRFAAVPATERESLFRQHVWRLKHKEASH